MSCNYADGLSPYENKGVLGKAEKFDSEELVNEKCKKLVKMILASKHTVIHTGAGISTSAGIPDFRLVAVDIAVIVDYEVVTLLFILEALMVFGRWRKREKNLQLMFHSLTRHLQKRTWL